MKKKRKLQASELWYLADTPVLEVEEVIPDESFYPVYRWKQWVSYSPLQLLKIKGNVKINPAIHSFLQDGEIQFHLPPDVLIDQELERVGGPLVASPGKMLDTPEALIQTSASAMIKDAAAIEARHPGSTIYILTAGKDSLNLLLLPWKNKVCAISGDPNYPLVADFCKNNQLNIPVLRLEDEASDSVEMLEKECLINCCRTGLPHVRWTQDIAYKITCEPPEHPPVLLVGSFGDILFTPKYRDYRLIRPPSFSQKLFDKTRRTFQSFWPEPDRFLPMWYRGAQWQGVYHGIIREALGVPNYSGYHGTEMLKVIRTTDAKRTLIRDVRAEIGEALQGKPVIYPTENPSPTPWFSRRSHSTLNAWMQALKARESVKVIQ